MTIQLRHARALGATAPVGSFIVYQPAGDPSGAVDVLLGEGATEPAAWQDATATAAKGGVLLDGAVCARVALDE
jgi:hypothetical protein